GAAVRGGRSLLRRAPAAVAPIGRWFTATDGSEAPRPEDGAAATRTAIHWTGYLRPLGAWLVSWYVLSKVLLASSIRWNDAPISRLALAPSFADATGKIGWGSGDYWKIAEHGYRKGEALEAAFPLYALLTRWLSQFVVHDLHQSQVLIATAGGLAGTLLLWRLLEVHHVAPRARNVALALFLLYPYSFMLAGVGYSDPVLIPLILGAFLLAQADRPVAAGLVGAAATLTRPNALALVVALAVFQLVRAGALRRSDAEPGGTGPARWWAMRPHVDLRRLRPRDLGVGLSVLGVGGYAYWLQGHAGDPLYFLTTQKHYGHRPTTALSTWFKVEFVNAPFGFMDHGLEAANHVLSALVLFGAMALLPRLVRRLGWGIGTYAVAVVATAWVGPNGFAPAGRYLLPVLPFYALVGGELLATRRRLLVPLLLISTALALALAVAFANPRLWLEW
ncbi:MAG: putative lipoprotein, partial [Acidimicrobiales bacterium]|nr:putative lipoprotein [Acidimicrobiales bacterium]